MRLNFLREWLQRAWFLTPLVLMTGLVVFLGVRWLGDLVGERATFGTIVAGSPAIYTRERLVNDRFLQDSWLASRLDPSTKIEDSLQHLTRQG